MYALFKQYLNNVHLHLLLYVLPRLKVKIKVLWDYVLPVHLITPSWVPARWYGAARAGACNHKLSHLGRRSIRVKRSTRRPA